MVVGGLVVIAGMALAGCGAADRVSTSASAAEAVRFAGQQAAAESYAFEMTIAMEMDGLGALEMTADGAMDAANQRGQMTAEFLGMEMETVLDGTAAYTKLAGSDEWYRVEVDSPQPAVTGGGWDMTQQLAYLRMVSDAVTETGKEKVRGVETTKYQAFVSFDRAFEHLSDEDREMLEELTTFFEGDGFDILVWVDDEGRPAKMEYSVDMSFQGSDMSMGFMIEMFDWGRDVDVELPPADKVVDGGAAGFGGLYQ